MKTGHFHERILILLVGQENDLLGVSVAAGDVNGDGVSDAVMCYPGVGGSTTVPGSCAVIFGNRNRALIARSLSGLTGENGFVMRGQRTVNGLPVNVPNYGQYVIQRNDFLMHTDNCP